jgi:hypothetical protein
LNALRVQRPEAFELLALLAVRAGDATGDECLEPRADGDGIRGAHHERQTPQSAPAPRTGRPHCGHVGGRRRTARAKDERSPVIGVNSTAEPRRRTLPGTTSDTSNV